MVETQTEAIAPLAVRVPPTLVKISHSMISDKIYESVIHFYQMRQIERSCKLSPFFRGVDKG